MTLIAFAHRSLSRTAVCLKVGLIACLPIVLGGCDLVVMNPSGDIAVQQKNLIIASTALMLLVIIPVIALTFMFAWRYRASNENAQYDPDFHHSTQLEVIIWTIPLLIIMALGAMTWVATHTLDPFRALSRIGPNRPVPADVKPLEVHAVSLDWKWLFLYPEQGIASVNEMAAPVDRPILIKITSSSVWNTFYVPALAGMIYAMPGMETRLNAVINKEGTFTGLSAHYSGSGFSKMNFAFRALNKGGFDNWVAQAKSTSAAMTRETYLQLEKPSEGEPVRFFGSTESGLYDAILGMCVRQGQMCVHEMMHIDRRGGAGKDSQQNRERLDYDNRRLQSGNEPPAATFPASGRAPRSDVQPEGVKSGPASGGVSSPSNGPAPSQLTPQPAAPHRH